MLLVALWGASIGCSALLGFDKDVEERRSTRPDGTTADGGGSLDGSDLEDSKGADKTRILGELDPTFGDAGVTRVPLLVGNGSAWTKDMSCDCGAALDQAGGSFVACASPLEYSAPGGFGSDARTRVFRLDADGKVDPAFGAGLDGGPTAPVFAPALAVQSDGRVLAVGYKLDVSGQSSGKTVLLRFNADGTLDAAIGSGGAATPALSPDGGRDRGIAVAIAGDGALVAGQRSVELPSSFLADVPYLATIALGNGALEHLVDGRDPPAVDFLPAGILRPSSGRVVVYGAAKNADYNDRYPKLVGYVDAGLDPSFGDGGAIQLPDVLQTGMSLVIRAAYDESSGGRIVLGLTPRGVSFKDVPSYFARCVADGQLDSTFGDGGLRSITRPAAIEPPLVVRPAAVAMAAGGTFFAAGDVIVSTGRTRGFLARFHANGELDESFASGGYALPLIFTGANERIDALLVQPDGRVVVVGRALTNEGTWELFALRFR